MNLKVGQYVFVKDVVRSYSKNFDNFFKIRRKLKILSINENETVGCTACKSTHSPQIMLEVNFNGENTSWGFTPCELFSLKDKIDKLLSI